MLSKNSTPKVAIIMGSQSDYPVMIEAVKVLQEFNIEFESRIVSAHRTPELMYSFAVESVSKGFQIIIAGAGGSAHLPGMVASLTTLPVIGVPVESKAMKGIDSLYSIVQMPPGIPVATMAINGAKNAGLLAVRILALEDNQLNTKLQKYIQNQTQLVIDNSIPKL
jgi:5-(carboxyamino)imidazole ribonucleotide mutase